MQEALDFRAALLQSAGCTYEAQLRAQVGQEVYDFTLHCQSKTEGGTNVEVAAPETIAGITAEVSPKDGTITYDGMSIAFGETADGTLSPIAVPEVLSSCWREEYIAAAGADGGRIRVTYEKGYDADRLTVDTWLDAEKHLPIYAEICYNHTCVAQITLTDFAFVSEQKE